MLLKSVQIDHFKHVLDSTLVEIQPDITCLVGKNESGKTAFLDALRRLKPAQGNVEFSIGKHYPAWLEKMHKRQGKNLEQSKPIQVVFELSDADVSSVEAVFGKGVLTSRVFSLARRYDNHYSYGFEADEAVAVTNASALIDLPKKVTTAIAAAKTFVDLTKALTAAAEKNGEDQQVQTACTALQAKILEMIPAGSNFTRCVWKLLFARVPKFFFYSDYSRLPGKVRIRELLEADADNLDEDDQTALALLKLAGSDQDYLLDPDYETRKRELENVANAISQDVLHYWTTNTDLRVLIDISQATEKRADGQHAVHDEMHVRMYDNRHMLSLPFDERSSGFQWFFSFLTAFSRYEYDDTPVIILLDEPALGLHAKAQKDFLRFIEERLAKRCQVIYTTHSPFMIQPDHLERARLVEDKGRETGSVTTSDVLTTDRDTLFPLQAALGYDIAQHLFIAKDNLVVEGPSDFLFMQSISARLIEDGREGLNPRWSIMPLGGADVIPAFVALLGNHLDVTVVVDARKEGHQKLTALAKAGFLAEKRIITIGEIANSKMADIEDLFAKDDYVALYNAAFGKKVKAADLTGTGPIVQQIARAEGVGRYDHNAPAEVLLRERAKRVAALSAETLDAFEALFKRINGTLAQQ
ncbi:AAA family ATPase [Amaricoccus sp. W119]|uniref:AAA family ATPase n=1 Tax=Amaricoccus sp. W119 TaxID=3391833 RepID=UPI0039A452EA